MIKGSRTGLGEVGLVLCDKLTAGGYRGTVKVIDRSKSRNIADFWLIRPFASDDVRCGVLLISTREYWPRPPRLLFDHDRGATRTVAGPWTPSDEFYEHAAAEALDLIEDEFIRFGLAQ